MYVSLCVIPLRFGQPVMNRHNLCVGCLARYFTADCAHGFRWLCCALQGVHHARAIREREKHRSLYQTKKYIHTQQFAFSSMKMEFFVEGRYATFWIVSHVHFGLYR